MPKADDGFATLLKQVRINPQRHEGPEVPFPWPPVGEPVRYCVSEDELGSTDIDLKNENGQVVCRLARICTDFRAHRTNYDEGVSKVTVASMTRIFARFNHWVKDDDDPASYTNIIALSQKFYDRGYFDDPAHEHIIPLGWSERVCGENIHLSVASWPTSYSDLKPEYLWMDNPLPTFDERGYLVIKYHQRLSGNCGFGLIDGRT